MAEAYVSVLLEQLASITYQQIEKEVRLVVGVKKEVAKITSNLKAIQAVLEDAEKRQLKDAIVRDWLEKLKDVSYEMDDVLDEWTTEILIQQVDHHQQGGEGSSTSTAAAAVTKKKVCFFVPSNCFCFGQVNRVIHGRDIARRIQDLSDRLNEIARERLSYNFLNTERVFEQLERFETSSLIDLSKTFGREDETEVIVGKLVGESSQEERNPLVIPIVGMGGMGKTTLAQIVYNNEKVKSNFTKRIWVCVSDPFSEIKIAKAIIEDLNKDDAPNSNDLQPLLKCIQRNIEGQKFLLVLDDVWTDDDRKWEQLKLSLQSGHVGSRILVTTRKEEVAMMMGVTSANMIHLEKLSEECCWSIFYHIALAERERDESKVLESLGKDIVKRCKGLPLLAKVLGGLMRSKKTKKEWQDVLSSKIWGLDIVQKQVFQPLLLSYYDLTPMIKRCLLYCVTFPKDYIIDKGILIELWMSQGFLGSVGNKEKTMIDIGESYFDNLVMRSFFQNFKKDEFRDMEQCQMHDIVHDFLQYLTKNECLIVEFKGGEERIELPNKLRHLTIMFAPEGRFPLSFDHCQRLRTITTFNCRITSLSRELIVQLKCVWTLNLSGNPIKEVPDEVGVLVHLRYLDLSDNWWLKKLPDSLCNLVNLQTLRVDSTRLEKLPEAMGKLTSLQHLDARHLDAWHLDAPGCEGLKKLPDSLCNLVNLQTLRVDSTRLEKLPEAMGKLTSLQHLHAQGGKLKKLPDSLCNLVNLQTLRLNRCGELEKLPEAMGKLTSLQHLDAKDCVRLKKLPDSLCNLVNLQTLRVDECKELEKLPEAMGKLTSLQHLDAKDCVRLKKLPDSLCNLVNLQTLRVDRCRELEKLPEAIGKLTSLQHLHAQGVWGLRLPKSIARLKSLRTLDLPVVIEGEGEGSGDEEGLRLSDLRDMDELQGELIIRLMGKLKDSAASDAEKAKLVNKKHLLHVALQLVWESSNQSSIQEAVLNALQPNSNLESLEIRGYDGSTLYYPNWTSSLINLKSLTFVECSVCNYVPLSVLGQLGSLERLEFVGMYCKYVGFEYSLDHQAILFPNLKQLEFFRMPEWEEWDHDENDATSSSPTCFMPRLSTLSIDDCPKLKTLPDFLPTKTPLLQNLIINTDSILSQSCKGRQGPEWSKISHIPNIQIDRKTVQKDGVPC